MFAGRLRNLLRAGLAVWRRIDLLLGEFAEVTGLGRGAALAQCSHHSVLHLANLAVVIDTLSARLTGDAGRLVAGHLARVDRNADPLFAE